MSHENVHPVFKGILDSLERQVSGDTYKVTIPQPYDDEGRIPTSEGHKTIPEIMDHLTWCSYKANRGYGCSHEGLVRIGIGNDAMKERYERELKNQ